MELFKIASGPWEKIFSGVFQEHETELYSNPEKVLMTLIYEKKLDRTEGAIIELYKVFHAIGDVESFTETLPREAIVIAKHDALTTMKFLLLGSKPSYVRWVENEFVRDVDSLVKRLEAAAVLIKDVSKAYELSLEEISESTEDVRKAFFTMPILPPLLATSYYLAPGTESAAAIRPTGQVGKGDIIFGITKDNQRVIEPLSLFMKTLVSEGEKQDRKRLMIVIAESALLTNTPTIFFDFQKAFTGIGEANKNINEMQKYMVDVDPLGFPTKSFKPKESLRVNMNIVNPEIIAEAFGIGEKDFPRILSKALQKEKTDSIEHLTEKVARMEPTEEFSEFDILKAARLLRLIAARYPLMFGGENDIDEMARQGTSNIARAAVLEFEGNDDRSSTLISLSLIKEILDYYKTKGASKSMRAMIVVSSARIFTPKEKQKAASAEIQGSLKELPKYGIGFVLSTDHLIDIDPALRDQSDAVLNVVSGNDTSVQLRNRKSYRVLVRPTLSKPF